MMSETRQIEVYERIKAVLRSHNPPSLDGVVQINLPEAYRQLTKIFPGAGEILDNVMMVLNLLSRPMPEYPRGLHLDQLTREVRERMPDIQPEEIMFAVDTMVKRLNWVPEVDCERYYYLTGLRREDYKGMAADCDV